MRLAPITPFLCLGEDSDFDGIGDGPAMREKILRLNTLDVAEDGVRRTAYPDVSSRYWHFHPCAELPVVPFSANILY